MPTEESAARLSWGLGRQLNQRKVNLKSPAPAEFRWPHSVNSTLQSPFSLVAPQKLDQRGLYLLPVSNPGPQSGGPVGFPVDQNHPTKQDTPERVNGGQD